MIKTLENARLKLLAEYISEHMGLKFPEERLTELNVGIVQAAKEFGFTSADSCVDWLLSTSLTKQRIEVLASHLTVGETYFFRERKSLEVLQKDLLGQIRSRHSEDHTFRIWSAGCASGEEPYSVAISLVEAMPDLVDWNITILATDINARSLQKAAAGVYSKWSFRDCPSKLKERYFRETKNNTFEIIPNIKKMVYFAFHNLAEDPYPSVFNNTNAIDVIFCRNVLMYFTPATMKKVVEKLHYSLVDDGCLIVSSTETSPVFHARFSIANYSNCSIYKKNGHPQTMSTIQSETIESPVTAQLIKTQIGRADQAIQNKWPSGVFPEEAVPAVLPVTLEPARAASLENARHFFQQGQYAEAEIETNKLLKDQPGESEAMVLLARILANRGKLVEAVQWCQQGISKDKLNPARYYLLATILNEQGQIAESASSLRRAIYLNPNFVLAHFSLGNLTLRMGRPKEASRHLKNALSLLEKCRPDEILPESDGIAAGRLTELIRSYAEDLP